MGTPKNTAQNSGPNIPKKSGLADSPKPQKRVVEDDEDFDEQLDDLDGLESFDDFDDDDDDDKY